MAYWPFPLDQKANTSIKIFGNLPRDRSNKQHRYLARSNKKITKKALSKALSRLNILLLREDREIVLKSGQETAVSELLHGRDVMAV